MFSLLLTIATALTLCLIILAFATAIMLSTKHTFFPVRVVARIQDWMWSLTDVSRGNALLGDLEEGFQARVSRSGITTAGIWYVWQLLCSVDALLWALSVFLRAGKSEQLSAVARDRELTAAKRAILNGLIGRHQLAIENIKSWHLRTGSHCPDFERALNKYRILFAFAVYRCLTTALIGRCPAVESLDEAVTSFEAALHVLGDHIAVQ